jgi:hypothetical protein
MVKPPCGPHGAKLTQDAKPDRAANPAQLFSAVPLLTTARPL